MRRARPRPDRPCMSAALDSRDSKAVDLLLAHCAAMSQAERPRRPVFERLREKIGAKLARLLVSALSGSQRDRSAGRPG